MIILSCGADKKPKGESMQKSSHKRNLIKKIAAIVVELFVLLTAATIFAYSVLGWVVSNNSVSGNGMSVQLKAAGALQIRASADGSDIGVTEISADMTTITFPDMAENEIYPGVSGQITFYVHDGSEGTQNDYSFDYHITPKNDDYYDGEDVAAYPNGFYLNAKEADKQASLQYLASHVMFFESVEDGIYSDWINPESNAKKQVESGEAAAPCQVTVYWIWVPNYADIFTSPSIVLEESTRGEIENYYSQEGYTEKMFNGENSQNGFDAADTLIGITIKYMCFEIEVSKT